MAATEDESVVGGAPAGTRNGGFPADTGGFPVSAGRQEGLPVLVELAGRLGAEVAAFVEDEAGWQVVEAGGPLRPVLSLVGPQAAGPGCVVVTVEGGPPDDLRRALRAGALDAVVWPDERARLLAAPQLLKLSTGDQASPAVVGVAGTGGGAGTSTVALAVGALAAWSGARALVVGGDDLLVLADREPWSGADGADLAAAGPQVSAGEVSSLTRAVSGVPGLRVLRGGPVPPACTGWPYDVVVADLRVPTALEAAQLVVTRPDATAGRASATSVPLVVSGHGVLAASEVRRLAGRAPAAVLPASARVARAAVRGRVPATLPGSWFRALRAALRHPSPRAAGS